MKALGPSKEIVETWPEERKALLAKKLNMCPINVRILNGVEWDALNISNTDEGTEGYSVE